MKTYKTINHQNIYDVAVMLYGTIEGVFNLLAYNPSLSLDMELQPGTELLYDETAAIYNNITSALSSDGVVPANGDRGVYFRETDQALRALVVVSPDESACTLIMSGDGVVTVDWGDNTELEELVLQSTDKKYMHAFNTDAGRIVKLYGDFSVKALNLSAIGGDLMLLAPLVVDEIQVSDNSTDLRCLALCKGTYQVKMERITLASLNMIRDMSLQTLVLDNVYMSADALDEYLIYIARNHNERRNCNVTIRGTAPTGEYAEPAKDEFGNYQIQNGMEAIYVITHEIAWNEADPWVFDINETIYQYQEI